MKVTVFSSPDEGRRPKEGRRIKKWINFSIWSLTIFFWSCPKILFHLVRHYFFRSGHVFRPKMLRQNVTTKARKTFSFGLTLFFFGWDTFFVRKCCSSKFSTKVQKTFSFGQALFFQVGTRFVRKCCASKFTTKVQKTF